MGTKKLSRSKRMAASRVIATAALQMSTNHNLLLRFNHLDWGENIFTEEEKAYLAKLNTRLHKDSELILNFSHRLAGR